MRLINTSTLQLEEFFDSNVPNYAILSHRWEHEEVNFQDFTDGRGVDRAGYSKITGCCSQALKDGLQYAWVDSCCIDKTSSAELSEAINSMFRWYSDAQVCYVYLSDVRSGERMEDHYAKRSSFRSSKWFSRGWTLQELLAPEMIIFYDRRWFAIGTKARLANLISAITGISHIYNYERASVAQKMSWASRRHTTRIEDQAYCLMGLFNVSMPPLYGEGHNAFLRLQQEILAASDDDSIFAWTGDGYSNDLLAQSPKAFENSGNIVQSNDSEWALAPYWMTNKGLRVERETMPAIGDSTGDMSLMPLRCRPISSREMHVMMQLKKTPGKWNSHERINTRQLAVARVSNLSAPSTFFIEKTGYDEGAGLPALHEFTINFKSARFHGFSVEHNSRWVSYFDDLILKDLTSIPNQLFFVERARREKSNVLEQFTVAVSSHYDHPRIDICRGIDKDFAQDWDRLDKFCLDKLSIRLESGRSVTVVMKKQGIGLNSQQESGKKYFVEITFDPDGSLPWPDPTFLEIEARESVLVEGKIQTLTDGASRKEILLIGENASEQDGN